MSNRSHRIVFGHQSQTFFIAGKEYKEPHESVNLLMFFYFYQNTFEPLTKSDTGECRVYDNIVKTPVYKTTV